MVKIHFIGGENLVITAPDPSVFSGALNDPNGVLEVTHDGKQIFLAVRAIVAIVVMS